MKPSSYEYIRAGSLEDAKQALAATGDGDAKVLAGGQSLVPLMNFRLARPRALVDVNRIPDQSYRRVRGGRVEIGPLCRHRDIERDAAIMGSCDAIREAVPLIGHVAIRERGTVVGSFAHGDPLAEWSTLGVLLGAVVRVERVGGARDVSAQDWFLGFFQTALRHDEMATALSFDVPEASGATGTAFAEVARRHGDFCLASAAALVELDDAGEVRGLRLVVSGLETVPWSLGERASAYLGAAPSARLWERVADELPPASAAPSDVHALGATRRAMAHALAGRVLASASARADARRKDGHDGR